MAALFLLFFHTATAFGNTWSEINYKKLVKSLKQNLLLIKKDALNNKTDAQLMLGIALFEGIGIDRNEIEAEKWFKKLGYKDCGIKYGIAQYYLGVISIRKSNSNLFNKKVPSDSAKLKTAFQWFLKSANNNCTGSAGILGIMYSRGLVVKIDNRKSLKWTKIAAKGGDLTSQRILAGYYLYGNKLVTKDRVRSYAWMKLSINEHHDNFLSILFPSFIEFEKYSKEEIKRGELLSSELSKKFGKISAPPWTQSMIKMRKKSEYYLNMERNARKNTPTFKEFNWLSSIDLGKRKAKRLKNLIVLYFTANWCETSKGLENNAFQNKKLANLLKKFTLVKIDITNRTMENDKIRKFYKVNSLPQIVLIDNNGNQLQKFVGILNKNELYRVLKLFSEKI